MKKIMTVVFFLFGLVSSFGFEPVVKDLNVGGWDIQPLLYTRMQVSTEPLSNGKNFFIGNIRQSVFASQKNGLLVDEQVELVNVDKKYANNLRLLDVGMKLGDDSILRVGRVFAGAGYFLPYQSDLNTFNFMREPWGYYTYALQFEKKNDKIWFLTDIGGASGKPFNSSENFDRVEVSQMMLLKVLDQLKVGYNFQVSDDLRKEGLLAKISPIKDLSIDIEAYTTQGDVSSHGQFVLAAYKATKTIELHVGFDQQFGLGTADIVKAGMMYKSPTGRFRVIADYDKYVGDDAKSGLYVIFGMNL